MSCYPGEVVSPIEQHSSWPSRAVVIGLTGLVGCATWPSLPETVQPEKVAAQIDISGVPAPSDVRRLRHSLPKKFACAVPDKELESVRSTSIDEVRSFLVRGTASGGTSSYALNVRIVDLDGCEPKGGGGGTSVVGRDLGLALLQLNVEAIGESLRLETASFGWAILEYEILDAKTQETLYQGTSRARPINSGFSSQVLTSIALYEATQQMWARSVKAIERHMRGESPYGHLERRCLPLRDASLPQGCPPIMAVVHLDSTPSDDFMSDLEGSGWPVELDADALFLERASLEQVRVIGLFGEPDDARAWIEAVGIGPHVKVFTSARR
jgi:hypothetical protein